MSCFSTLPSLPSSEEVVSLSLTSSFLTKWQKVKIHNNFVIHFMQISEYIKTWKYFYRKVALIVLKIQQKPGQISMHNDVINLFKKMLETGRENIRDYIMIKRHCFMYKFFLLLQLRVNDFKCWKLYLTCLNA